MASMPVINIDQHLAEVGVNVVPAQMHITNPRPEITITQERPEMEIDRKSPSFKINRKKLNSEMGLKPASELTTEFRNQGKSGALEGTRSYVKDGNFLGNLKNHGDRVGQLARNKAMSAVVQQTQVNIEAMPKNMPEVVWDKGYVRVNWSKHSIVIEFEGIRTPQVVIDPPYSVEVYLRTEPYFRITVEEGPDPNMPGGHVDRVL